MNERLWIGTRQLGGVIAFVVATSFAIHATDLVAGTATTATESTRINELLRDNRALISRVTKLEGDVSRLAAGMTQIPSRVQSPFEVVDAAGNSLFMVTGDHQTGMGKNSRVRIGRASGDNFYMAVRNAAGANIAVIGERETGAGGVSLKDPSVSVSGWRTEVLGDLGLVLRDPQGKEIGNLGFTTGNSARSRLQVNGELRAVDPAGKAVFMASDAQLAKSTDARVQVGHLDGNAYGLAVRTEIGVNAVTIGGLPNRIGLVQVADEIGRPRTSLIGDSGLVLRNNNWKEVANLGFDPSNGQTGWLRVMPANGTGKPIFTVSDAPQEQAPIGHVHIGRGSGSNYGMWVRGNNDEIAASVSEAKSGGGLVSVRDLAGKPRAELFGPAGLSVYNPSGKEVVGLGLKSSNLDAGILELRGVFQIFDAAGETMVEAGTSPGGVGVVRVGPGTKCVPLANLRVPDCIMGRR
jgi:hypothetical protein